MDAADQQTWILLSEEKITLSCGNVEIARDVGIVDMEIHIHYTGQGGREELLEQGVVKKFVLEAPQEDSSSTCETKR